MGKCIIGSGFAVLVMSYYWKLDPPGGVAHSLDWNPGSWWPTPAVKFESIPPPRPNLWILGWHSTDWTALHPQYLANNRGCGTEIYILYVVFTARKRSCGNVMFLHLSVSHSVQGGGLCIGGCLHPGGSASRGGVCIQRGGLHPWGVCIQRGLHPGGFGLTPPPQSDTTGYGQRAGGTHPTVMYSCFLSIYISLCTVSYSTTNKGSFREKVYFRMLALSLLPQSEFCIVKLISSRWQEILDKKHFHLFLG